MFGVADRLKGQLAIGLLVLNAGVDRPAGEITGEAVALVRDQIGAVAAFKTAAVVGRLPKTRSGKILRGTMRSIADGDEYAIPATIDDPAILDEIRAALQGVGLAEPSGYRCGSRSTVRPAAASSASSRSRTWRSASSMASGSVASGRRESSQETSAAAVQIPAAIHSPVTKPLSSTCVPWSIVWLATIAAASALPSAKPM